MRADRNSREIKAAAEKLGCSFEFIRSLRPGCPDALVGFRGHNFLWEIKVPKEGRLSESQKKWRDGWSGDKPYVICTLGDVVAWHSLVSETHPFWRSRAVR